MIAYTVICSIENEDKAMEWLKWLTEDHIDDVKRGGAISASVVKMDDDNITYEIRYYFADRKSFDSYLKNYAPSLREEGLKLFPEKEGFTYSRTIGEIL